MFKVPTCTLPVSTWHLDCIYSVRLAVLFNSETDHSISRNTLLP